MSHGMLSKAQFVGQQRMFDGSDIPTKKGPYQEPRLIHKGQRKPKGI